MRYEYKAYDAGGKVLYKGRELVLAIKAVYNDPYGYITETVYDEYVLQPEKNLTNEDINRWRRTAS